MTHAQGIEDAGRVTCPNRNPGFAGMAAKMRGEPCESCPYEPGPQRTAWVTGWYVAAQEGEP